MVVLDPEDQAEFDLANVTEEYTELYEVPDGEKFVLFPGQCALAATAEHITIGPCLAAEVDGRSSFGRLFQMAHTVAGFCDPGFSGTITLELVNLMPVPVTYTPGLKVAQIRFTRLHSLTSRSYANIGNYQGQVLPREAGSLQVVAKESKNG